MLPQSQSQSAEKFFTLSEFRREVGLPLVLVKKLIIWGEVKAEKALDGTLRVAEPEIGKIKNLIKNPRKKLVFFFRALGPGLITGAADDDPGGIGTYSSAGAKFGLGIIWMAAWLLPVMLAAQEVCARLGIITNKGLAGVLQQYFRKPIIFGLVGLLLFANIVNIGADLGAMAASLKMLSGFNFYLAAIIFAAFIILVEVFVEYHLYVKFLKWLAFSLLAYVATGLMIGIDWPMVLREMIVPQIKLNQEYLFAMIAVFGTSVTPYLFFWQTSEEVEENKLVKKKFRLPRLHQRVRRMRTDVSAGIILANLVFFFIILTTAQVFFKNGITEINSAEQAALALRPLVGDYAYFLFAFGIIGAGLLAVPVLAGSGAYALAELMKWREGLEMKFSQAKGFYWIIIISVFLGLLMNFFKINPIKALYYSAFINGLIALPLLTAIMIVGDKKKIVGAETHPFWVRIFGWAGVLFMFVSLAAVCYFYLC